MLISLAIKINIVFNCKNKKTMRIKAIKTHDI